MIYSILGKLSKLLSLSSIKYLDDRLINDVIIELNKKRPKTSENMTG